MGHSGARLLVVENEPDLQEVMVELLEADGFEVVTCDSVGGALGALAAQSFQLVLTDFQLGGPLTPWQELERILEAASPAPVGIITGAVIDREEARRRGFAFILQKPFEWDTLMAQVEEHLRPPAHQPIG